MGDRCNIVVKESTKDDGTPTDYICFYSHWGGFYIKETLQFALKIAKDGGRLTDFPYLNRIIFSTMTEDARDGTTGFGISTQILDNEHPILILDVKEQTVEIFYNKDKSLLLTIDAFLELDFSNEDINESYEYGENEYYCSSGEYSLTIPKFILDRHNVE